MNGRRSELRLADAILLVIGTAIGGGIFVAPNLVARQLPSDFLILAAWAVAGLLALCGALAVAELGGMFPSNGGFYVYLREAYGPLAGFLAGWTTFLILYSGGIAWIAVSFSLTLRHFVPLDEGTTRAIAVALIGLLAAVNIRGLAPAARTQDLLTILKIAAILLIAGTAWLAPAHAPEGTLAVSVPVSALGVALIACLLSFDGWIALSFVAGEVRDPQRTVPRALGLGLGAIILLYLVANLAYLRVLTPAEIAASERVASDVMQRAMGPAGASLLAAVMLLSMAGALNGLLLATPRLYQAMAADGLFFRRLAAVHPRFGTPAPSIGLKATWSALLVLTGTYETLAAYAMFAAYIFYGLTAAAVVVLRCRRPDAARPYRMTGYPITPALFVLVSAGFVLNTLLETPGPALTALGLIALGIPAYWFWRRRAA